MGVQSMSDTFVGNRDIGDDQTSFVPNLGFTKLYGLGGDDRLGTSINGLAYLEGGQGDDYLLVNWAGGTTTAEFYGGSGNDRIQGGATEVGDAIYTGDGDDIVEQQPGGSGADYIEGGRGRDALRGEEGDDAIFGGDGDDSGANITAGGVGVFGVSAAPGLFGGAGNDLLEGGLGNDLLDGGLGFDTYVGGQGNDIFDFNSAAESPKGALRDLILDFRQGDLIDVSGIDAIDGSGDDPFDFIGKKGFHDEAGELRFKGQKLRGDTDGDGVADFEVKLDGITKLKDADLNL